MAQIKVNELSGSALDWAVAICEGEEVILVDGQLETCWTDDGWEPSTDWAQGGPIIEREKIELKHLGYEDPPYFGALKFSPGKYERKGTTGLTPLIAAMRCYVASKMGNVVAVPDELIK